MITLKERKIRGLISPRGRMSCSLNASSIFGSSKGFPSLTHIHDGMRKIRVLTKTMAYSIEVTYYWRFYYIHSSWTNIFSYRRRSMGRLWLALKRKVSFRITLARFASSVRFATNFRRVSQLSCVPKIQIGACRNSSNPFSHRQPFTWLNPTLQNLTWNMRMAITQSK